MEAMRQAGTGGVGSVVVALETAKWVTSESNPVEKEPTSRPTHARSVRRKRDRGADKLRPWPGRRGPRCTGVKPGSVVYWGSADRLRVNNSESDGANTRERRGPGTSARGETRAGPVKTGRGGAEAGANQESPRLGTELSRFSARPGRRARAKARRWARRMRRLSLQI